MEAPTQGLTPLPVAPQPSVNGPPPPPPLRGTQNEDNGKRKVIVAAIAAGLLAIVIAAATVVVLTSNDTAKAKNGDTATYQRQIGTSLQPLVAANVQLSAAMNAADGSAAANNAITVDLKNAQTSLTSTQGAVGIITVPAKGQTLSQQTSQALTQESGYLQVVSATVTDPTSASAAQVQPSATNLISSLIPLNTVAPGAQESVYGFDNFYNWSQGAAALIKKANTPKPSVIVQPTTTITTPTSTPSYSGGGGALVNTYGNISATADVSSSLANNVFYQYWNNGGTSGSAETVSAWSAATGQYYTATCSPDSVGDTIDCYISGTTDPNAEVAFPYYAIQQYTQAQADAFANSGAAGP